MSLGYINHVLLVLMKLRIMRNMTSGQVEGPWIAVLSVWLHLDNGEESGWEFDIVTFWWVYGSFSIENGHYNYNWKYEFMIKNFHKYNVLFVRLSKFGIASVTILWVNFYSLDKSAAVFQIVATIAKLIAMALIIAGGAYCLLFKGYRTV